MSTDKRPNASLELQTPEELDEAQLAQTVGGASDYLLQIDGIKGETGDRVGRSAAIAELSIKQR